jgi:hypothetical protein
MPTYRLLDIPAQFEDANGRPRGYAQMRFDVGPDTSTKITVYEDINGGSAHSNPVVADSTGLFAPVYVDTAQASIRIRADVADGDFSDPLWEAVFTQSAASATEYDVGTGPGEIGLNDGANIISGNRSVTGNNTYSGSNTHTGTEAFTAATVTLAATATVDSQRIGFRDIPLTQKNATYTLVAADAGKGFYKDNTTAYSYTIPPNSSVAFPIGTVIQFLNLGSSNAITVVRGSGVACRLAGVSTNDDWEIAAYGEATIQKVGTDSWVIRGTGVST